DYLFNITDKRWVLERCTKCVAYSFKANLALLDCGLQLTCHYDILRKLAQQRYGKQLAGLPSELRERKLEKAIDANLPQLAEDALQKCNKQAQQMIRYRLQLLN